MQTSFYKKYSFAFKWFCLAIVIKLILFVLFAVNFVQNWPSHWVTNFIFISSGDTTGYYNPIESFVDGHTYNSFCRMPGLLPIYGPLYLLFGSIWGKTLVIVLQFLTSALSVYVLAKTASLIFKYMRVFYITFFLYAISSFVSIWDHYGYSDSFSTSFMIFSLYYFVSYFINYKNKYILISGIFIGWSLFFRPINGLVFACLALILLLLLVKNFKLLFKAGTLFVLPCVIALVIWTAYNVSKHNKFIYLQGSFEECYATGISEQHLAIRDLIIAWGGDFQEWSIGTEAEWFYSKQINYKTKNPFPPADFTSQYNLDSLIQLKINFDSLRNNVDLPEKVRNDIKQKILVSTHNFYMAYKSERPLRYYLLNRIRFFQRFIFPLRLDNLPFPKVSEMKFYQKAAKGGFLLLLDLVSLIGMLGIAFSFSAKNLYGIIPLSIIFTIACFLGFVEQRYLVPAYPFLIMYGAYFISRCREYYVSKILRE